jgi:hypothetical protein
MDTQLVVKGWTDHSQRGMWSVQTFEENGVIVTGSTAHSEPGKSIAELSASTATPQVRVSTLERIRETGGNIIPTRRSHIQPYQVTITGLSLEQLDAVFDPPITSPFQVGST